MIFGQPLFLTIGFHSLLNLCLSLSSYTLFAIIPSGSLKIMIKIKGEDYFFSPLIIFLLYLFLVFSLWRPRMYISCCYYLLFIIYLFFDEKRIILFLFIFILFLFYFYFILFHFVFPYPLFPFSVSPLSPFLSPFIPSMGFVH